MVWLCCAFLLAGLVKGISGMGLPTVAMGLLGSVMSPASAAAILVIPSFVTNVWQLVAGGGLHVLWRRLSRMLLGIVIGTVAGAVLLVGGSSHYSGVALGAALIVYGGYALLGPSLRVPLAWEWWLSPVIGVVTGLITGVTGVFVMPAVPYLQALDMDKDRLVQALGLSFTVSTIALALALLLHGGLPIARVGLSILAVIPALIGMWIGQKVRNRISARAFRRGFLIFLILLGGELVARGIIGLIHS
ncbi:membrane protein [Robbsia andropogonis]|uniref:Probable membrane transporter protein n=1 Tax=Robbsia andropogonis TaxID=28092 RepID=A0A0F5K0Q5_9BURK|nr:sulfite exporter TauE/SafE family protein [Robbsia andropogonis]KKB63696.1 membrane protein [Robbsia andropogonis]MCP1119289.1 sulfite exporter TauE/SafE family protein [Robbsia andropogonis]MCP1129129.1 sulfite exporter TauE/SafE family protein [Robbsia andropogonis]